MSIIATAVKHLIAAGVSGDDLVRAIADMEAQNAVSTKTARQERNARYYRRLDISVNEWKLRRQAAFERDGFICQYCGADVSAAPQCDHFMPLVAGGNSDLENLVTSCKRCNSSKAGRFPDEWRRNCQ